MTPCPNCNETHMSMVPRCPHCAALLEDGKCPVCRTRPKPQWWCEECSRWL